MSILKSKIIYLFLIGAFIGLSPAHSKSLVGMVTEVQNGQRTAMSVVEFIKEEFESGKNDQNFSKMAADYVCFGRINSSGNNIPGNGYFVGPKVAALADVWLYFKTFLAGSEEFIKQLASNYNKLNIISDEYVKKHLKGVFVYSQVAKNNDFLNTMNVAGLSKQGVLNKWQSIGFDSKAVRKAWQDELRFKTNNVRDTTYAQYVSDLPKEYSVLGNQNASNEQKKNAAGKVYNTNRAILYYWKLNEEKNRGATREELQKAQTLINYFTFLKNNPNKIKEEIEKAEQKRIKTHLAYPSNMKKEGYEAPSYVSFLPKAISFLKKHPYWLSGDLLDQNELNQVIEIAKTSAVDQHLGRIVEVMALDDNYDSNIVIPHVKVIENFAMAQGKSTHQFIEETKKWQAKNFSGGKNLIDHYYNLIKEEKKQIEQVKIEKNKNTLGQQQKLQEEEERLRQIEEENYWKEKEKQRKLKETQEKEERQKRLKQEEVEKKKFFLDPVNKAFQTLGFTSEFEIKQLKGQMNSFGVGDSFRGTDISQQIKQALEKANDNQTKINAINNAKKLIEETYK